MAQTNFEWIRSLSIEEMAKVIVENVLSVDSVSDSYCTTICPNIKQCSDEDWTCQVENDASVMDWLKAERGEGDG